MRRLLLLTGLGSGLALAIVVGYARQRAVRADELVARAEQRLGASLAEAPELDRLQAATASSLLDRAIALSGPSPVLEGRRMLAEALLGLQQHDLLRARGSLASARARLGGTVEVEVLAGAIARGLGDGALAERHVEAALSLAPRHPRALLLRADLALDRQDGEKALACLRLLSRAAPDVSAVANRLGLAEELVGNHEAAEAAFRRAVELNGNDPNAHINLGRAVGRRGDLRGARDAFRNALDSSPGDAQAYLGLCLAEAGLGDDDAAESACQRAAELDDRDGEAQLALGDLHRARARLDEAVALYQQALERDPEDVAAWLKLGNVLVARADLGGAERAYRVAIQLSPRFAPAHNGLGATLMHMGRIEDARVALELAAALDVADPNPYLNLGLLAERTGDRVAARAAFENALARDPDSDVALDRLARL